MKQIIPVLLLLLSLSQMAVCAYLKDWRGVCYWCGSAFISGSFAV